MSLITESAMESFFNTSDFVNSDCNIINTLNSTEYQCAFLDFRDDCGEEDGILNYLKLFYCTIGASSSKVIPLLISSLFLFFLFLFMGVTAEDFLCPNLVAVSNFLGLSQNIAGVTFLAFGNGAPDIFSSIAGIRQARAELVIGELFGAGIFVTTVVVGSILVSSDFKIMQRPIARDILFYGASCFIVWSIIYQQRIYLWQVICILCVYLLYITVVIVGRIIYQRQQRRRLHEENSPVSPTKPMSRRKSSGVVVRTLPFISVIAVDDPVNEGIAGYFNPGFQFDSHSLEEDEPVTPPVTRRIRSSSAVSHGSHRIGHHRQNYLHAITHSSEMNPSEPCQDPNCPYNQISSSRQISIASSDLYSNRVLMRVKSDDSDHDSYLDSLNPLQDLLYRITPFSVSEFKAMAIYSKVLAILKSPFVVLISLTTPIVDTENHRSNWCRLLNCFHCLTGPLFLTFLSGRFLSDVNGFPISVIVAIFGIALSIIVFCTSKFNEPPKYHAVFSVLGFIVAGAWTYFLAAEVVSLLKAVGILISFSDVVLGLTVLAWGNSLGDFISNLSMAKQGFPKMGISACFGGPLLNLLIGVGIPYTMILPETASHSIEVDYPPMITLLIITLIGSLIVTFLIFVFTGFQSGKLHGVALLVIYGIYLTIAILLESGYL